MNGSECVWNDYVTCADNWCTNSHLYLHLHCSFSLYSLILSVLWYHITIHVLRLLAPADILHTLHARSTASRTDGSFG